MKKSESQERVKGFIDSLMSACTNVTVNAAMMQKLGGAVEGLASVTGEWDEEIIFAMQRILNKLNEQVSLAEKNIHKVREMREYLVQCQLPEVKACSSRSEDARR